MQRRTVHNGDILINCSHRPLFMRWSATLPLTVIAIEDTFVANALQKELDGAAFDFSPLIGINDTVIRRLVEAADAQIDSEPAVGGLFADSVATALLVRIFDKYNQHRTPPRALGGLTPRRLTRIIDYIESSLNRNLENRALAEVLDLSAHHFAECFTRSMGIPPHHYVTQRRIQKAKGLLLDAKLTTAEIAELAGFSSQSHFTARFRQFIGVTPARFRRETRY
ncbi:MAG: helix-turn-helix transcriptional regulator [Nitrospiraceae bacterium]